jgi:uncharacterized protein YdeI (YjbR/CyaY-like superfamily)
LDNFNCYLLFFPEEHSKQLDQDEIIEISDQAKAPDWLEAMVNTNIDIFEMPYEETISYFMSFKNFEKSRCTMGQVWIH